MMHLADQATPTELRGQGRAGRQELHRAGRGSAGRAADREVEQFDGRILILRWIDPEVQGRYGTMVYVRCPAEGVKKPKPKGKPKPRAAAKPAAKPAARQ